MKNFQEFLSESSVESNFSKDKFTSDIKNEMDWNSFGGGVTVEMIDPKKVLFEKRKTPAQIFPKCNIFFMYTGAPGQSVKKDIEAACKKHGYTTARVGVIANYARHDDHYYLIGLSVPPVTVTAVKFGL